MTERKVIDARYIWGDCLWLLTERDGCRLWERIDNKTNRPNRQGAEL